jgi:hypothetical protein
MKTSSATVPRTRPDEATGWACLVANTLTLPGLGSIAAGRRIGYAQAAIALVGFAGSMLSVVAFGWQWVQRGELPQELDNPVLLAALASIALFGFAWVWALATSLDIRAESRRKPVEPGVPPRLPPNTPPKLPSARA